MNQTIDYYNQNAQKFYSDTIAVDMSTLYKKFLALLPKRGRILDVGCGSGRDALYFKQQGHDVTAFDASVSLCTLASNLLQQEVLNMTFSDVTWQNQFEGIWACASLLHCPEDELIDVINKLQAALIDGGVMYLSFKYGDSTRENAGRVFTDLNEETLKIMINQCLDIYPIDIWATKDNRKNNNDEWINCLLYKRSQKELGEYGKFFANSDWALERLALYKLQHIRSNYELFWDSAKQCYEWEENSFVYEINNLMYMIDSVGLIKNYHALEDVFANNLESRLNYKISKEGNFWIDDESKDKLTPEEYTYIYESGIEDPYELLMVIKSRIGAALKRGQHHIDDMEHTHAYILGWAISSYLYHISD